MPYYDYQTKRIYYKELGKKETRPLIFLHGNAVSSKMFEPILSLYKKNFTSS